jgi:hypothetical protein
MITVNGLDYDLLYINRLNNDGDSRENQNNYRLLSLELERVILNERNGFIFVDALEDLVTHVTFMPQTESK